MSKKRRQYSPQFKSRVALEAIQGVKTVSELSSQHSVHPTLINQWKRQLLEGASSVFDGGEVSSKEEGENKQAQIDELYRQIGKLKVERDFLAECSAKLGLSSDRIYLVHKNLVHKRVVWHFLDLCLLLGYFRLG